MAPAKCDCADAIERLERVVRSLATGGGGWQPPALRQGIVPELAPVAEAWPAEGAVTHSAMAALDAALEGLPAPLAHWREWLEPRVSEMRAEAHELQVRTRAEDRARLRREREEGARQALHVASDADGDALAAELGGKVDLAWSRRAQSITLDAGVLARAIDQHLAGLIERLHTGGAPVMSWLARELDALGASMWYARSGRPIRLRVADDAPQAARDRLAALVALRDLILRRGGQRPGYRDRIREELGIALPEPDGRRGILPPQPDEDDDYQPRPHL
jgi:hypothetical protein